VYSVMQENPTSSIDLVCKMEEIGEVSPILADSVMDAGYHAIDKLCSKVVSMWLILQSSAFQYVIYTTAASAWA
jgi:hypothetical protein